MPWNKNKKLLPLSNEIKQKMSKSAIERIKKYPYTLPNFSGYKHTKKSKEKISKARMGIEPVNKGKKMSIEIIEKNRLSHIGIKHTEKQKNKMKIIAKEKGFGKWMKGKKLSQETKKKLSEKNKGEKSYLWRGGITLLNSQIRSCFEYRQWRSDIFTRDNFTCQKCGKRGCYLEAHHIISFSELIKKYNINTIKDALNCEELWNINNGITLCKKCHNSI